MKDYPYEVSFDEVRAKARGHFFDRESTRFFKSSYPQTAWLAEDGSYYFVTGERFENLPRKYTVRRMNPDGTIDTVGEFQQYYSRSAARRRARECAIFCV